MRQLRECGLPTEAIEGLITRLRHERTSHLSSESWPTLGEDRKVLSAAASLAHALATVLDNASPRAEAEIETAALALGRRDARRGLCRDLDALAGALDTRLAGLPAQSRNRPRVGIVWALDEVAGRILPAPTTRPGSPYYIACCAAFILAGYPFAPDKAIRQFIDMKSQQPEGR